MTNIAIINNAKLLNGVTEDVDTFAGWNRRGRKVKKGCKALFKTSIWKPRGKQKTDEEQDENSGTGGMFLVEAAFFGISQTEEAKEVTKNMVKKYRVNESEHFNLCSMYEHLMFLRDEMQNGNIEFDDSIYDRIDEVRCIMDKAYCVGALVDWDTLKRVREIRKERQMIRYTTCLAQGTPEREAAIAFDL